MNQLLDTMWAPLVRTHRPSPIEKEIEAITKGRLAGIQRSHEVGMRNRAIVLAAVGKFRKCRIMDLCDATGLPHETVRVHLHALTEAGKIRRIDRSHWRL